MPLSCAKPRAAPHPKCLSVSSSTLSGHSSEALSRYERIISLLSRQAVMQQREIADLKAALSDTSRGCTKTKGKSSSGWRRRVERYAVALLEAHLRGMDERLAQCIAERFREVTREHVVRSIDKQVHRVLYEATAPNLKQTHEEEEEEEEEKEKEKERIECDNQMDALQRRVALLERRLAEAAHSGEGPSLMYNTTLPTFPEAFPVRASSELSEASAVGSVAEQWDSRDSAPLSPPLPIGGADRTLPPSDAARHEKCESLRWRSSSHSLTNSTNASSLSDDIKMLMDVFQGKQSLKVVQRLLE